MDLRALVLDRIEWAARQSGDPLRVTRTQWSRGVSFLGAAAYEQGLTLMERTRRDLGRDVAPPTTTGSSSAPPTSACTKVSAAVEPADGTLGVTRAEKFGRTGHLRTLPAVRAGRYRLDVARAWLYHDDSRKALRALQAGHTAWQGEAAALSSRSRLPADRGRDDDRRPVPDVAQRRPSRLSAVPWAIFSRTSGARSRRSNQSRARRLSASG
jgi:hypothetical protein